MATNQSYRCSSLARYRRRIRREIARIHQFQNPILREMHLNNLLFNEQILVAQGY